MSTKNYYSKNHSKSDNADIIWVPNYHELKNIMDDEKLNKELAEHALFDIRVHVRAKGIEVTALTKIQEQLAKQKENINNFNNIANNNSNNGGGPNAAKHPELEDANGAAPDNIVLPESEELTIGSASNDPKLQHKLKQKMASKFGMGSIGSLSKEALEAEYKKKMSARIKQKIEEQPRFRAREAPKNTPS